MAIPVVLALNLLMCLFVLSIFGVLDDPLADLSLRPAAASLICLCAAGLLLLEDVEITSALLVNPGGFIVPMMAGIALCANARPGTRKYLLAMSALIAVGAWMFNQIAYRLLETVQDLAVVATGLFCVAFANLLDNAPKPVLMMSIFSFHLCDILGYFIAVVNGQAAYVVLGDGVKAAVMAAMPVAVVALCRMRAFVRDVFVRVRHRGENVSARPEST